MTAASAAETYGIVEMLAGDPAAAERELAAGYGALEEMGETQNFPDLAAKLADALYEQGEDDRALELSEVSERATAPDDLSAGVQWRGVRAKLLARRGDAEAAEALAREARGARRGDRLPRPPGRRADRPRRGGGRGPGGGDPALRGEGERRRCRAGAIGTLEPAPV